MGPKEFAFDWQWDPHGWYTKCADGHKSDYNARCKRRDTYKLFLAEINKNLRPSMRVLIEDILEKHPSVTSFFIGPFHSALWICAA